MLFALWRAETLKRIVARWCAEGWISIQPASRYREDFARNVRWEVNRGDGVRAEMAVRLVAIEM